LSKSTHHFLFSKPHSVRWVIFFVVLTFIPLFWVVRFWAVSVNIQPLREMNQVDLFRFTSALSATLNKNESIPHLLSLDPRLQQYLNDSANTQLQRRLNHYLELVNRVNGTAEVYLMNQKGITIAASNWNTQYSFVNKNFGFRPYFKEAMEGRIGHYYALGTTSHKRGYYISAPISDEDNIIGVVVVKIGLDKMEKQWRSPWHDSQTEMIVTDPDGVIFVSTQPGWLFRSFHPLSKADLTRIKSSQRYPSIPIASLQIKKLHFLLLPAINKLQGERWISIQSGRKEPSRFYMRSTKMPNAGWRVHALTRINNYEHAVWLWIIITFVVYALLIVIFLFVIEHIRHEHELEKAKNELEQRVKDRTKDLEQSNQQLREEITDHQKTENVLRNTQDQLIQSAKMAVLGQMSAGINHELNQPLTAIRAYAQNGRQFLSRKTLLAAEENFLEIINLTDHMSSIIGQFKVFARKSQSGTHSVSVHEALKASLKILKPLLSDYAISVITPPDNQQINIKGDLVQLEQVFINLISNAAEALKFAALKQIQIEINPEKDDVFIKIFDTGPGINPDYIENIFSPFFTTRDVSEGLGLGLSISHRIIENFGGGIHAANSDKGGAVLTFWLPRTTDSLVDKMPNGKRAL